MRFVSLFALVGALFAVSPAFAADVAKGKEVFTTNCLSCHGPEGKGDGPAGAALTPKPSDLSASAMSEADMTKIVTEGAASMGRSPLMVAWKGVLQPEQIADVVAYVRTLKK